VLYPGRRARYLKKVGKKTEILPNWVTNAGRLTFFVANESQIRYLIGEFELEPETHRLLRQGSLVHLTNKPFKVLNYLIANRNRVVSRVELLEQFWDGRLVYEETLTKCIGAIRRALEDPVESPRFIETHWAEGYRFVHPVEESYPEIEVERFRGVKIVIEENDEESFPTVDARRRTSRSWLTRSAVAAILVMPILALGYWAFALRQEKPEVQMPRSIAVLPVKISTEDQQNEFMADGITDGLINNLLACKFDPRTLRGVLRLACRRVAPNYAAS